MSFDVIMYFPKCVLSSGIIEMLMGSRKSNFVTCIFFLPYSIITSVLYFCCHFCLPLTKDYSVAHFVITYFLFNTIKYDFRCDIGHSKIIQQRKSNAVIQQRKNNTVKGKMVNIRFSTSASDKVNLWSEPIFKT